MKGIQKAEARWLEAEVLEASLLLSREQMEGLEAQARYLDLTVGELLRCLVTGFLNRRASTVRERDACLAQRGRQ